MADSPGTNDPLDEAFAAYLRSCDTGELSSREDFLAQFPDLADDLKQLMEAADMIGQVTLGGRSSAETPVLNPGAETVSRFDPAGDISFDDPAATLPMANRAEGDPGPTLPYDLGDYELMEIVGRGGMGVVYLAKQHELDRHVAVKMIRSGLFADEAEVRRFYTEAQAAARLHHPGIVSIHQFGHRAGHHFFSMEYICGTDLQRKIAESPLDPHEAARYVRDVADAIHHAHQKGVLHRDLKPANVLIDEQDQVHVTDFGLAKHMDSDSSVTGSGAAIGTPHYMAPEQAGGQSDRANRQSDVYALGAILFACVTGRPPIVADTVMQTLVKVVHHPAPPVRSVRSDVPIDLETIIAKCLEKKPSKRYGSAEELVSELTAFLEGRPIAARPRSAVIKAWHWLEGVPLVGAVTGRRVLHPSTTHRRFQAALLLLLLITPIITAGLITMWQMHKDAMPDRIRIAGGVQGGVYHGFSSELSKRIQAQHPVQSQIIDSGGSIENRKRLLNGVVDLAPMQATAISGDLCVVAPLFYELMYVLARTDSGIKTIGDLDGRRVAVGSRGSGSPATADLVFNSLELESELVPLDTWQALLKDPECPAEAAMICVGRHSQLVTDLLETDKWRVIPIKKHAQIAWEHPTLLSASIHADEFPDAMGISEEIPTLGTTAFLAARKDTPAELVMAALHALYAEPAPVDGLIPRSTAAEWHGLDLHDAARDYFAESQSEPAGP